MFFFAGDTTLLSYINLLGSLNFSFQVLQEAYSRCLSEISRYTEPGGVAVQVRLLQIASHFVILLRRTTFS